jgi:outer membrane protein OmpA-like peptidoglycan-associated protein
MLPELFATVRRRKPTEISIFGHTDTTGSEQLNLQLSAERAKIIEQILRQHDPELDDVELKYFGDKKPLVPTAQGVPEPRNRRVEIVVL